MSNILYLSNDLHLYILKLLSSDDILSLIRTCNQFATLKNKIFLLSIKLDYLIYRNNFIVKSLNNFISIKDNIYITSNQCNVSRLHPLFLRNNIKNKCIVSNCREKKLDYIYIKLMTTNNTSDNYIKRKIPYCLQCFKIWHSKDIM
jgi:hypothetical protein